MTGDRAAWWVVAFTANAILIGLAPGFPAAVAPALIQLGLAWWFVVDLEHHPAPDQHTAELLREVLEEHGPMECDPTCGCSACRAWAHLQWIEGQDVPTRG